MVRELVGTFDVVVGAQSYECDKSEHTGTHMHAHMGTSKSKETWIRCVDYFCVNILARIPSYGFASCYHWGRLGKGHRVLPQKVD